MVDEIDAFIDSNPDLFEAIPEATTQVDPITSLEPFPAPSPTPVPTAAPLVPDFGISDLLDAEGDDATDQFINDNPDLFEDQGGFVSDAVNVGLTVIEGGIRQAITLGSPTQKIRKTLESKIEGIGEERSFGTRLSSAAGQVGLQIASIGGATLLGGPLAGIGVAALTALQGIRAETQEAEDQARERGATDEEVEEIRSKAMRSAIVGEGLSIIPIFRGAKVITKAVGKAIAKPAKELAEESVKQVTRLGRAANVLKSGLVEGSGELITESGKQAAIESVLGDKPFITEFAKAAVTPESREAAAIGFILGTGVDISTRAVAKKIENLNLGAGLDTIENIAGEEPTSTISENALKITEAMAELESVDTATEEIAIPREVATSQELTAIVEPEGDFEVLPTEDGEVSILKGKADRLRELQKKVEVLREETPELKELRKEEGEQQRVTEKKIRQAERAEERVEPEKVDKLLKRAGVAEERALQAKANIQAVRDEAGVEGLTKDQIRELVSETEGLETFFDQADAATLKEVGLIKQKDKIIALDPTPEISIEALETFESTQIFKGDPLPSDTIATDVSEADTRPVQDLSSSESARNTNPIRSIGAFIKEKVIPKGVKQFGARKLTVTRGLPQEFFNVKVRTQNQTKAIRTAALLNAQRMDRLVNKEVGFNKLFTPTGVRLRNDILRKANAVMVGEADINVLPEGLHSTINAMRGTIDKLSLDLINEGVVEGDLVQKFEAGIGTYLNRSYKVFDTPSYARTVPEAVLARADGLFKRQLPRQPEETTSQYDARVRRETLLMLHKHEDSPVRFLVNSKSDSAARGILQAQKNVAPEIRALWGERTTALSNYASTVIKQAGLLGTNRFVKGVKEVGMGDFLFVTPKEGFTVPIKVSQVGEGLVGPNGETLFTSPELAEEFSSWGDTSRLGGGWRAYMLVNGLAKAQQTIFNLSSQVRNFLANFQFLLANGNFQELRNTATLKEAASAAFGPIFPETFFNPDNPKGQINRDYFEQEIALGVVGENVQSRELQAYRDDFFSHEGDLQSFVDSQVKPELFSITQARASNAVRKGFNFFASAYSGGDAFHKVVAHESEMSKYRQAFPELSEQELRIKTAEIVRNTMPTYSLAPELIQEARRLPFIAPFVIFPAEVIRTQFNTVKLIRQEIADPRTRSIGYKRMAGLLSAYAAVEATIAFTKMVTGTTDQDEKDLETIGPPWSKGSAKAYTGHDDKGNIAHINMSYTNPFAIIRDPMTTLFTEYSKPDASFVESIITAGKQWFDPLLGEELVSAKLIDAARNQTETGRQVYNPEVSPWRQGQQIMAHIGQVFVPGTYRSFSKIYAGYAEEPIRGVVPNGNSELAAFVSGQKREVTDPERIMGFKTTDFQRRIRNSSGIFSSVITNPDRISNAQIRDALDETKASRNEIYSDIREEYMASSRLSGDNDKIRNIMIERGIGKGNMSMIEQNKVPKFQISSALKTRIERIPGRLEQLESALDEEFVGLFKRKKIRALF